MSREVSLIKNTAILSLGTFLPKVASLVVLPILTGRMTEAEYGTYDLVTILVVLLLPAFTLEIQASAFRFLIDVRGSNEKQTSIVSTVLAFIIAVSIPVLAIVFVVFPAKSIVLESIICGYFLVDVLNRAALQCVRGIGLNLHYSVASLINSFSQLVFAVAFVALFNMGLTGSLLMLLLSDIIAFAYLLLFGQLGKYLSIKHINWGLLKELLSYSWPMVPNNMSMWAMRMSNRLVITFFMGIEANAAFAVAYKIPQIITLAQNTFSMAWQESASISSSDVDAEAYYSRMFRSIFDFMAGTTCLLTALTPLLFSILIKGNYASSYGQIPLLIFGLFFSTIAAYLGGIYVAYKQTKNVGITTVVSALINLLIDLLFIPQFGLTAASMGVVISYAVLAIYRMLHVRRLTKIDYQWGHYALAVVMVITSCLLCANSQPFTNLVNAIYASGVFLMLNKDMLLGFVNKALKLS